MEDELPGVWKDGCECYRLGDAYQCYPNVSISARDLISATPPESEFVVERERRGSDIPRRKSWTAGNLLGSLGVVLVCVNAMSRECGSALTVAPSTQQQENKRRSKIRSLPTRCPSFPCNVVGSKAC